MTKSSERAGYLHSAIHIYEGLVAAHGRWPEVSALAFAAKSTEALVRELSRLLDVDELQARAISDMQIRRLGESERASISRQLAELREELSAIEQR